MNFPFKRKVIRCLIACRNLCLILVTSKSFVRFLVFSPPLFLLTLVRVKCVQSDVAVVIRTIRGRPKPCLRENEYSGSRFCLSDFLRDTSWNNGVHLLHTLCEFWNNRPQRTDCVEANRRAARKNLPSVQQWLLMQNSLFGGDAIDSTLHTMNRSSCMAQWSSTLTALHPSSDWLGHKELIVPETTATCTRSTARNSNAIRKLTSAKSQTCRDRPWNFWNAGEETYHVSHETGDKSETQNCVLSVVHFSSVRIRPPIRYMSGFYRWQSSPM